MPIVDQHHQLIHLWVHSAVAGGSKPDRSKINGMFFAATNEVMPPDEDPKNLIELCEAFSRWRGDPPFTDEERATLNLVAVNAMTEHEKGTTAIQSARRLRLVDQFGYLLGFISLFVAGFSWWILILAFGTWFGHGSARHAAKLKARDPETMRGALILPMAMHFGSLMGLIIFSMWRMVTRY